MSTLDDLSCEKRKFKAYGSHTHLLLSTAAKKTVKIPMVETNRAIFEINKRKTEVLVDTGASVSAISQECLKRLVPGWKNQVKPPVQEYVLRDVQGREFAPHGTIDMNLSIDDDDFAASFFVLKDLPAGILLGMPFLIYHNAQIVCQKVDLKEEQGYSISVISASERKSPTHNVYVKNQVELPPLSLSVVPCYVNRDAYISFKEHIETAHWQFDDHYDQDGSTLSVKLTSAQPVNKDFMALCQDAVILLKPDSDCVCHIINPTSQPISISADLHIAHMTLFEPHTIDAAYRCTDTTVNGEEQFDEIHEIDEMSEDDGQA